MNEKQQRAVNNLIEAYNKREQARVRYANAVRDFRDAINAITPALELPEVFAIVRNSTVYTVLVDRMDGDHKVDSFPLLATAEVSVEENFGDDNQTTLAKLMATFSEQHPEFEVSVDEAFGDDNQATRHINVEWRTEDDLDDAVFQFLDDWRKDSAITPPDAKMFDIEIAIEEKFGVDNQVAQELYTEWLAKQIQ